MYELLIKKLDEDNTLTKLEFARRYANVLAFWSFEGEKFERLREELVKDNALVMGNCCQYFEYWHKFKLLCEGKELSAENVSNMDLDEVFKFRDSVLHITPTDD